MSRRKQIRSKQHFDAALALERSGDPSGALKLYQKSVVIDPSNAHSWNRQMILYRKTKSKEDEVKLIKTAISEYERSAEGNYREWLEENQEKAESSRELAKVLGLIEPGGMPKNEDATIEKWQTRLYLLEYRISNARKKKTPVKKTKSSPPATRKPASKQKSKLKGSGKR